MSQVQAVRGTRDLLPEECRKHRHIINLALEIMSRYGFHEMETPILEPLGVFARTLGEETDVVAKEMYTFKDRGGDDLVLRPEGTAGIARAFVCEGLAQNIPLKVSYCGPMFRYERPQKGRYRQFYQIGAELMGSDKPQADIEVIAMAQHLLEALGLKDRIELQIHSMGDPESRAGYKQTLVSYLESRKAELSNDSQTRLEKNPLRILDSKDAKDRAIIKDAPKLLDALSGEAKDFFAEVCKGLDTLGIKYTINPYLVRGFDYYGHTVFEFVSNELGAQGTVLGGGRYNGLVQELGGPSTPSIGWGAGLERLAMLTTNLPEETKPIAIVPLGEEAETEALKLTQELRAHGFSVDLGFGGNMGKRMKRADKIKAFAAVILGSNEIQKAVVSLKVLSTGTQKEVPRSELAKTLREELKLSR